MRQTRLPVALTNLPEEASFYLPLDLGRDADAAPRILVIVDDGRLQIDRGKLTPDAQFFSEMLDGENVIAAKRMGTGQSPARWKLYEVTIDRRHA